MHPDPTRERRFLDLVEANRALIYKICYMYAGDREHLNDLYQDVLANVWQGLDSFRGDSAAGTWLYRIAINTCITNTRINSRHTSGRVGLDSLENVCADDSGDERMADIRTLYAMIASLPALDKAIILMWLDEKSYEEIASVSGLSRQNVGIRLHRIKQRLAQQHHDEHDR